MKTIRQSSIGYLGLFFICIFISSCLKVEEIDPPVTETIVRDNVIVIEEENGDKPFLRLDSISLVLSRTAYEQYNVEQGSVLVGGITEQNPFGFLRKINEVTVFEDSVCIKTEQAALDEVFEKVSFKFSEALTDNSFSRSNSIGLAFEGKVQGVNFKLNGTQTLKPELEYTLDADEQYLHYKLDGDFNLDAAINIEANPGPITIKLDEKIGRPIRIQAGYVPLFIIPRYRLKAVLNTKLTKKTIAYQYSKGFSMDMTYFNGDKILEGGIEPGVSKIFPVDESDPTKLKGTFTLVYEIGLRIMDLQIIEPTSGISGGINVTGIAFNEPTEPSFCEVDLLLSSFTALKLNLFFKELSPEFKLSRTATVELINNCPEDRDGDGIPDDEDECDNDAGPISTQGCPDKDMDGVIDKIDACLGTALGVMVDEFGCPIELDDLDGDGIIIPIDKCPHLFGVESASGCPDSDGDGIRDSLDLCLDTDIGARVNYQGCKDTDGDSVPDTEDECDEIPGFLGEFKGCPDGDEDGVADYVDDDCPTEVGPAENRGCPMGDNQDFEDDDQDGVENIFDNCPNSEIGVPVDIFGCRDTDGDGISDDSDDCPNKVGEYSILGYGCPQVDDDQDGVANLYDVCPGTEANRAVNESGCPDTDEDGVYDNEDDCIDEVGPESNNGCPPFPCPELIIVDSEVILEGLNECQIDAGTGSNFKVYLETNCDLLQTSNNGSSPKINLQVNWPLLEDWKFIIEENKVRTEWCIRFGDTDVAEMLFTISLDNGLSRQYKVNIPRPDGAALNENLNTEKKYTSTGKFTSN